MSKKLTLFDQQPETLFLDFVQISVFVVPFYVIKKQKYISSTRVYAPLKIENEVDFKP